jgi:hypothetical protein
VGDRTFNYRVKYATGCNVLTVEFDGFYGHKDFDADEAVTPAKVEAFILNMITVKK